MEQDTVLFKLKKLFLPDSSKWGYWVLLSLAIHSLYFIVGAHIVHTGSLWGMTDPDTDLYFKPYENLFLHGKYEPDYRMPGYGATLFPLLFLFSRTMAYNVLLLLQLAVSSVAVYALALTAKLLFKNQNLFIITFITMSLCYFVYSFDVIFLTESFTTSVVIFSIYFMTKYFEQSNKKTDLFLSGLFITCSMFLRPVFAPLPAIFVVYLACRLIFSRKSFFIPALIFITPFILLESFWLKHNYSVHHKIVPLITSVWIPSYDSNYVQAGNEFFEAWGGGYLRNDPKFEHIPEYVYTSKFNADSLLNFKKTIAAFGAKSMPVKQKMAYLQNINNRLSNYSTSIKEEKPFLYYIQAPLSNIPRFYSFSTMYDVIFFMKSFGWSVELVSYLFYYFIVYVGMLGILISLLKFKTNPTLLLVSITAAYIVLIHSLVLREAQNRYIIPVISCFLLCSVYFCNYVYKNILALRGKTGINNNTNGSNA